MTSYSALGFPCPGCDSPGPHHIQAEDKKGRYLMGYVMSCHSCEHVWYQKI